MIKHSGSLIALATTNNFSSLFIQFLIHLLAVFVPAVQRLEVANNSIVMHIMFITPLNLLPMHSIKLQKIFLIHTCDL